MQVAADIAPPIGAVFDSPVRLLVADDDPIMREIAATQFRSPSCDVETAENGLQAWWALASGRHFDLALIDLDMPELDGFALIQKVRADERLANLPIVVVTGRDDLFAIDRAYETGATSFAAKPVNWRLLAHQLRYVLRMSRAEADLRAARDTAQRANSLKDNLLALLQHETRTPLHLLIGHAGLIEQVGHDRRMQQEAVRAMSDAAKGLESILRRIFLFGQLSAGTCEFERETLPANDIAEDLLKTHAYAEARRRGGLVLAERSAIDAKVSCDLRLTLLALSELLDNALRHSGAGQPVEVHVRSFQLDAVAFEIVDHGRGLAPDMIEACLAPFGQGAGALTRASSGLGFGLPLAREIAIRSGGRLMIDSAPGEGLVARLILPAIATGQGEPT